MRNIALFGVVVGVLVLIGVGTWIGFGTPTSAIAGSTVDPSAMMAIAKDLPTSQYVDYSVVFN